MNLANKVALITGGSKGLGLALARELGERGSHVAIVARSAAQLAEATEALRARGISSLGVVADIGDKEAIYPLIGQVQGTLGPIDILIHNASTLGAVPLRPLADTDCEALSHTLEVNVVGPFRLTKALVPGMLVRGEGAVLHISSDAAVNPYPNWGAYGLSKAALDQLSRILAAELADTNVRVLSIDPGEMDTDMHRAAIPDAEVDTLLQPQVVARRILSVLSQPTRFPSGARVLASKVEIRS